MVFAVCSLALLLGGGAFVVRPWFVHSFDVLDAQGVGHADVDVLFRRAGAFLAMLFVAAPALSGAWLLRRSESRASHVAWFGVSAIVACAAWALWVGIVLHNTYLALFTQ